MGCRHSSSPPVTPIKTIPNRTPIVLKSKISVQRSQVINHRTFNGVKALSTSRLSISAKKQTSVLQSPPPSLSLTALCLEQTLDGRGESLIRRFELDAAFLLLDVSRTHTLLLDGRELRLINMETMNIETRTLPLDCGDIQEIVWSSKLNAFLLLTTDRLYRTSTKQLHPTPIPQIQFTAEGPRRSYMAIDDDDLLINRSFGHDIRRYSLSNFSLVQSPRTYVKSQDISVTTIRLNSHKILALAISMGKQQMIDLVHLNTDRLLHRIHLHSGENILYPIDLHNNGQWFAKTCTPCVNIGHCLISSNGILTRLNLFPQQDNFIRSLCMSPDNRWLLVVRQHALELYQPCTPVLPVVKDLVGVSNVSIN